MYLILNREAPQGNAVRGHLFLVQAPLLNQQQSTTIPLCSTLENLNYLIPPLIYRVAVTHSPKFKRLLPIVQQVPDRSGIRFHPGTRPEHSRGCILLPSRKEEQRLTQLLLSEKEVFIEVNNAPSDR